MQYLCMSAKVSRSGYYYWCAHHEDSVIKDCESLKLIQSACKRFHNKAGIRTIKMYLEFNHGIIMNTKKIARLKRQYGLNTVVRRKNKYNSFCKARQEDEAAPNLVNMQFKRTKPDEVYSTDITYLPYHNGRAFMSAVKDLASREIVHYSVSSNINLDLACDGMDRLFAGLTEDIRTGLIVHSDQGSHYTSPVYRNKLKHYGITQSMSRKGNCLDNAPIESFFGHMKDEIDLKNCKSFNEVKDIIDRYIEYYNHQRPQWTLKKMTPAMYRCHLINS